VGPVVQRAILQKFGGTKRWDRWDHHDRCKTNPADTGTTCPTCQYRLLAPKSDVVPPVPSVPLKNGGAPGCAPDRLWHAGTIFWHARTSQRALGHLLIDRTLHGHRGIQGSARSAAFPLQYLIARMLSRSRSTRLAPPTTLLFSRK
jgi:hypothetical protein